MRDLPFRMSVPRESNQSVNLFGRHSYRTVDHPFAVVKDIEQQLLVAPDCKKSQTPTRIR